MYSEVFCKVYDTLGWNYYPEAFGQQLLAWLDARGLAPKSALDLACGTGILCQILDSRGIRATGIDLSEGMIAIARAGNPRISYDVADMVSYCPGERFDLVTCTGDSMNHILKLQDLKQVFRNIYTYLAENGWLVFDLLKEQEISSEEPFEMDFDDRTRVWFQMTRSGACQVNLQIRVFVDGEPALEETITETLHDPAVVCRMLQEIGFSQVSCSDRLLESQNKSTTWYLMAKK